MGSQKSLFGLQGRAVGQQMIESGCHCVDITSRVGMTSIATVLLQRGIKGGSPALDNSDSDFIGRHLFDQSEVYKFDQAIGGELQIAWLDVAVDHGRVLTVEVMQGVSDLVRPFANFMDG